METNIVADISAPIPYLAKFWFSSYWPKYCHPVKLQDSLKCNISRKKWTMRFVSGMQIKIEVFYKSMLSFWVWVTRNAQNTQNKKFAYLCNISRKTWEVKLISCLQINTKISYQLIASLWVSVARHAQSTQKISLQCLYNTSRET